MTDTPTVPASTPSNYEAILQEAKNLHQLGIGLIPVIPVELPATDYPSKNDPTKPAFTAKNPSQWDQHGKPKLLSHKRIPTIGQTLGAVKIARDLGKPIGLAIVPADNLVVVDFDLKDYAGDQDALVNDVFRLLGEHPELRHTRIEQTPGGGVHIYLRVADRMASWSNGRGGRWCRFTTAAGGPHRGEVLSGTRISVTAPTRNGRGPYEVIDQEHAYVLAEVPDLEAIGIFPVAGSGPTLNASATQVDLPRPQVHQPDGQDVPVLADLLGRKAQEVLHGGRPYGEDRSGNFAGFLRELYSWVNFLAGQDVPFDGSPDQLIAEAVAALGIEDKAERVAATIDTSTCTVNDHAKALARYRWHAGQQSRSAAADGFDAVQGAADQAAINAAIPGALEQQAPEPPECIAAEARAIAAEVDRQEIGQCLSLSYLLPAAIAHAVEVRTRYQPTDGPSAAITFLSAVAGLLKLGTRIEASAVAGYSVPVNLFACLVGKSGAMKSPVGSLLVNAPTAPLRQELAAAHEHALETWREQCRGKKKEDRPLPPRAGRIVVSDYTGEALAAQLQEQEKRGAGLLIHRDELSGLFGSLNQYRSGKGGDEQQLLELYDGNGLTSLRVVGDRHYSRSQLSIYGGTQPDVLRELVADGDASGLWARFLFVPLPARVVPLPLDTTPAEVAAVEAAADTLKNVCRQVYTMPPRTYKLSREAALAFRDYHASRQRSAQYTIISAQSAIYGKSAGKVLRIAGVLHVLGIAAGEVSAGDPISADIIKRATALVDHLDAWALSFHAEVAAGGVPDLMRNLHTIALAAAEPVTWREVSRKLSRKQRDGVGPDDSRAAMQELARMGYGELLTVGRSIAYRATGELP